MKRFKIGVLIIISLAMALSFNAAGLDTQETTATLDDSSIQIYPKYDYSAEGPARLFNVDGRMYINLRDLAVLLGSTQKRFNIGWDDTKRAVTMYMYEPYASDDMTLPGNDKDRNEITVIQSTDSIYLNGKEESLTVYKYKGQNYVRLQEIAVELNFGLTWDVYNEKLGIDTMAPYTELRIVSDKAAYFGDFAVYADERTISPTGLTLKFENDSAYECLYGSGYGLECKIDGKWQLVPNKTGRYIFTAVGYYILPGKSDEWTIDWEWSYGKLKPGHYRILKSLDISTAPNKWCEYIMAPEFTIS